MPSDNQYRPGIQFPLPQEIRPAGEAAAEGGGLLFGEGIVAGDDLVAQRFETGDITEVAADVEEDDEVEIAGDDAAEFFGGGGGIDFAAGGLGVFEPLEQGLDAEVDLDFRADASKNAEENNRQV